MNNYAEIVINSNSSVLDKLFTYRIPEMLTNSIRLGHRVFVPFGQGNKKIQGFVLNFLENIKEEYVIKDIIELCDELPLLREVDIKLIKEMKVRYLCSYLDGIKAIIPTGITSGAQRKVKKIISIKKGLDLSLLLKRYIDIYRIIEENDGIYDINELNDLFSISKSSINTMIKKNFLLIGSTFVDRYDTREYKPYKAPVLNEEQTNAINEILYTDNNIFLIHGVTGSGKTEIYMSLVDEYRKLNKASIILVPEIALTPQMIERFKGRFGSEIAVFHSRLSIGERYDEWVRVKEGKVKIAIGARSAVFLPFDNIGVIIIDEEQEGSYKSENDPKYNAREIGEIRSKLENAKLVLGTATPALETYYRCTKGEIKLIELKKRVKNLEMPEIEIIDMREELKNNNKSIFSDSLYKSIDDCLKKKEQIVLFLNRRGHSTFVSCRKCGYVFKCKSCDVAMTYHKDGNYLSCHYCGRRTNVVSTCPNCKSKYVKYFGIGTEKLEVEIKNAFPLAKVIRMDLDTTRDKTSYESFYNSFKSGETDILLGTQMIAKGLDFENVTLVGVIAADLTLNLPDFRAAEKTFQLLTQVTGRAGRGEKKGKVIVQTYNPEHYSIKCINDYAKFYINEISIRRELDYPPFSKIFYIVFNSKNEVVLKEAITKLAIKLMKFLSNNDKIRIYDPSSCEIKKINDLYRYQLIIKGEFTFELAAEIKKIIFDFIKPNYTDIRIGIDINPNNLI